MKKRASLIFICFSLLASATGFSASSDESEEALARKSTSALLREADREIKAARKAAKQGRMTEAPPALDRYSRRMEIVNRRIDQDPAVVSQEPDVIRNVGRATSRHTRILEELLLDAPDPARPGLMRALEASRTGHRRASDNLERTSPSQRGPAGVRPGQRRGPPELSGPSSGAGRGAGPGPRERRPRGGPPPF